MLFKSLPESIPFLKFQDFYLKAEDAGQPFAEAGCISSVDQDGAPHGRYVNFKYFFEDNLIFFSSYTSNKALDFEKNKKVAINFWWPSIDVQIRAEGMISQCPEKFSDEHFYGRERGKNIAAIASDQSKPIDSYEMLEDKYEHIKSSIESGEIEEVRPENWGGYQVKVTFFEFWEANKDRLNYRECFIKNGHEWNKFFLQS
ncbi:pyridoxal 5'-phosphate synthase [Gammaproteobacteria bacterium]|nr:pyridoxal 5'-phosphate synthase [Gammaproteobacteria bacterium]